MQIALHVYSELQKLERKKVYWEEQKFHFAEK